MKVSLLSLSIVFFLSSLLFGQDSDFKQDTSNETINFTQKLRYSVSGGFSLIFPVGKTINDYRSELEYFTTITDSTSQTLNGGVPLRFGFHFGFDVSYPIADHYGVVLGLQYRKKGYQTKSTLKFRDPIFQYDESVESQRIVTIHHLEIPVLAYYAFSEKFKILGGFSVNFPLIKSLNKEVSKIKKDVVINGQSESDKSYPFREVEHSLEGKIKTMSFNGILGAELKIIKNLSIRITNQVGNNLFKDGRKVANVLVNTTCVYTL